MITYISLLLVRLIINFADSLFYVASIWLISQTSTEPFVMGAAVCLFTLPDIFLMLIGPIVDRMNPKPLLILSLIVQFVSTIVVIVGFNDIGSPLLLLMIFFNAFASALSYPLEETVIPQVIEKKNLMMANSIFTISFKIIDSLFNAISGFLLTFFSIIKLYALDAGLVVLAFVPLFFFRHKSHESETDVEWTYANDFVDGLKYIKKKNLLLVIMMPLVLINFLNAVNAVALPYYCSKHMDGAFLLSCFLAASGIGGIIGSALSVPISKKITSGKLMILTMFLKGTLWIFVFLTDNVVIMSLMMLMSYLCGAVANNVFSGWFQIIPPIRLLGRVNTIADSLIAIAMPIGGLAGGVIIEQIGETTALILYGFLTIIVSATFLFSRDIISLPLIEQIPRDEAE